MTIINQRGFKILLFLLVCIVGFFIFSSYFSKVPVVSKEVVSTNEKIDVKKPKVTLVKSKNVENAIEENANAINIAIPNPPKPPKVIKVVTVANGIDRSIKFSKRVPPNYITSAERYTKVKVSKDSNVTKPTKIVGVVDKGRISAYLRGELLDVKTASDKLKNAGFEVIVAEPLDDEKTLISIVFTSPELKKMASVTDRGFMGTLRLLIDSKNKMISITNPLYLAKAFMQDKFNNKISKKILVDINKEFSGLKDSLDKLKFQLLPKYQFMMGMPYFEDMEVVARGDNLLEKLEKNKKKVLFQLKLNNGSILVGIKLSNDSSKFPEKIGTNNAGLLPYTILIENGEAKILAPKYYLSLMYPQLAMEEFMTIATVPGAIITDCEKVFQ